MTNSAHPIPHYGYSNATLTSRGPAPSPSSSHPQQCQEEVCVDVRQEFDDSVSALCSKVKTLKRMTHVIADETRTRGKIIDGLTEGFESAKGKFAVARRGLGRAYKRAKSGHMTALMCFSVVVLLGLYAVWKTARIIAWFV